MSTYYKSRSVLDVKDIKTPPAPAAYQKERWHTYTVLITTCAKYCNRRIKWVLWKHKGRNHWPKGIWKGFNKQAAFQLTISRKSSKHLSENWEGNLQGKGSIILKYKSSSKSVTCSRSVEKYNRAYRQEMTLSA